MNKKRIIYVQVIFLLGIVGALTVSFFIVQNTLRDRLLSEYERRLYTELELIVSTVRNGIIMGNTRKVRNQLANLVDKEFVTGFLIQQNRSEKKDQYGKVLSKRAIKVSIPVYYEVDGEKWGNIYFFADKEQALKSSASTEAFFAKFLLFLYSTCLVYICNSGLVSF